MNFSLAENGTNGKDDWLWKNAGAQMPPHWAQYAPVSALVFYIWGSVLLIIGVVGVIGNGIVLFVFTR